MKRTLTGRGVLLWLALFFGVVILTDMIFVTVAVKTFRGEDEEKPYLQGIAYNQTLARRAEQARLGWHAVIAAERMGDRGAVVDLDVVDATGAPKAGLILTGELRHPSDEHRDRPAGWWHRLLPRLRQFRGSAFRFRRSRGRPW